MQIFRENTNANKIKNELNFKFKGWEGKYLNRHPGLQHMSDARRKQQRRRSQLLASNWENHCLLRMSSITPHQTAARPVLRESQERWEKSLVCVFVFVFLSLTFWIHLPALQVNASIHLKKYDYSPLKSSFRTLHVPSVFLVTVTYSSCREPDIIFFSKLLYSFHY